MKAESAGKSAAIVTAKGKRLLFSYGRLVAYQDISSEKFFETDAFLSRSTENDISKFILENAAAEVPQAQLDELAKEIEHGD